MSLPFEPYDVEEVHGVNPARRIKQKYSKVDNNEAPA